MQKINLVKFIKMSDGVIKNIYYAINFFSSKKIKMGFFNGLK